MVLPVGHQDAAVGVDGDALQALELGVLAGAPPAEASAMKTLNMKTKKFSAHQVLHENQSLISENYSRQESGLMDIRVSSSLCFLFF